MHRPTHPSRRRRRWSQAANSSVSSNGRSSGNHYVEVYAVQDRVCVARERISVPIESQKRSPTDNSEVNYSHNTAVEYDGKVLDSPIKFFLSHL
ncbi:nucleotide-binding domain-containing protein [Allopusillimonas soli]|uniref:nucleotide-binding domain-containing protein n=1 Tax=Allopusillimonas soli TaxID=659016 RepID=UPI003CC8B265